MNAELLQKKLLVILHRACSQMRYLVDPKQIFELADTVEFIPEEMLRWRPESEAAIRWALKSYQQKYPQGGVDYLGMLEMDDDEFRRVYVAPRFEDSDEARAFIKDPTLAEQMSKP